MSVTIPNSVVPSKNPADESSDNEEEFDDDDEEIQEIAKPARVSYGLKKENMKAARKLAWF